MLSKGSTERAIMSIIAIRSHQLFPVLNAGQIGAAKRFASGPARAFAPGIFLPTAGLPMACDLMRQ